jgi:hypothetical protein
MFPNHIDLRDAVAELTCHAATDGLALARDAGAWQITERWLQVMVAKELGAKYGLTVRIEVPVEEVEGWLQTPMPLGIRWGKLDVVLFERSAIGAGEFDELRGIVEMKRLWTGFNCVQDAVRIRQIGTISAPLCGIVVGLFIGDPKRVVDGMAASLQIDPGAIVCRPAATPDPHGVSYGAAAALIQG